MTALLVFSATTPPFCIVINHLYARTPRQTNKAHKSNGSPRDLRGNAFCEYARFARTDTIDRRRLLHCSPNSIPYPSASPVSFGPARVHRVRRVSVNRLWRSHAYLCKTYQLYLAFLQYFWASAFVQINNCPSVPV